MTPTPAATYRLQLSPDLDFARVRGLLDYLQALGVECLYLSPIFEARPGSRHGYDVVDPRKVRAELGGRAGFDRLVAGVMERDMRLLLDIVPNHMAAHAANPWWWSTLRDGPESPAARHFDIDWRSGAGRLFLPVLGRPLEEALAEGELRLARGSPHHPTEPVLAYFDQLFPLREASWSLAGDGNETATVSRELLELQWYRLLDWRQGARRINYRRFFDITHLVGVRVEDEEVFTATHDLVGRLARTEAVAGLRVDHVDGLRDPVAYLDRLRSELAEGDGERSGAAVWVEKILAADETLPTSWPVEGTTGYDFLAAANRVFVDATGWSRLREDAARRTGLAADATVLRQEAKLEVLESLFPGELERLVDRLVEIPAETRAAPPRDALRRALMELTAALDVYRTYALAPGGAERRRLEAALEAARIRGAADPDVLKAIDRLARLLLDGRAPSHRGSGSEELLRRWQQLCGATMAKGLEDTALYRHVALTALDEVGSEPGDVEGAVERFHQLCAQRAARWPRSLNASATHDTKRGEDTRARIGVLSQLAQQWIDALDRWFEWHRPLRRELRPGPAPSAVAEILIYQSLLGIWPLDRDPDEELAERMVAYAGKAVREAKLRTSWRRRDPEYEEAVADFARHLVVGEEGERFRRDAAPLAETLALHGAVTSLAQLVLKCLAPGIPDFYQGTELWQLVLVDPDNRRLPDFAERRRLLGSPDLSDAHTPESLRRLRRRWTDGAIKMALTTRLLALRRRHRELFDQGDYVPLQAQGRLAEHVLGFRRRRGSDIAVAVVPRLTVGLTGEEGWPVGRELWRDTRIPWPGSGPMVEWLTGRETTTDPGGRIELSRILDVLPVAVLVGEGA